jgi:two-component system CheB/CheR fusion protein
MAKRSKPKARGRGKKRKAEAKNPASRSPVAKSKKRRTRRNDRDATPQSDLASFPNLPSFPVVGIGASAGGLEAFTQLLGALSPDVGVALILIQHLAPRQDSMLVDLLGNISQIPVAQATNGLQIQPNRAYVIPPNTQMAIIDGRLHLAPRPTDRTQYKPVDFFFRSLAAYAQTQGIGVVLSGTDSDGAIGLREIKAAGGITIAQDPKSAQYDGMPRAAITTSAVDLVLPPNDIATELIRISRHPFLRRENTLVVSEASSVSDEKLRRIFLMLRNATGVDFSNYKQPTIRRRLQRRMVLNKITGIDQYLRFLQQNPPEVRSLYQDILIHVTRFFRDPETYQTLSSKVLPQIMGNRADDQPIRVWVPGCSTGEEAYSIAMTLLEYLGEQSPGVPVQIFATDVSENAVEHARAGIYPESIAVDVSAERLRRFFTRSDGNFRVSKVIREMCVVARQDLTRDPPFSKLDLIVCRNVLIYLGPVLQKRLMNVFHYALKPTGFLMLGGAETIGPYSDLFAVADKRHRIYTKKAVMGRMDVEFPPLDYGGGRGEATRKALADNRGAANIHNEANRVVLSRFSPPGVIVDADLRIVQFRGQTGTFLEPSPGEASLNLLKMAREGLLYGLRTAIQEARKTNRAVRKDGLRLKRNGHSHEVTLEVIPLTGVGEGPHFLILFQDLSAPAPEAAQSSGKGQRASKKGEEHHVARLQDELAANREYLQSTVQDLEAANEELQSANEEILSSNEELQSTNEELDTAKEELQSTNEELNTVNEELQARNEELSRANSDLLNLLGSVQIAIVMVAANLRIRRYTPAAEKVLNLIPTDIGRPISDIKPNIDCPDLEKLIVEAIETVSTHERVCRDRNGKTFTLRIRPYKNTENRIDGAVLALFDVDRASAGDATTTAGPAQKLGEKPDQEESAD